MKQIEGKHFDCPNCHAKHWLSYERMKEYGKNCRMCGTPLAEVEHVINR